MYHPHFIKMPNQTCELSEISILILFHLPNCEVVGGGAVAGGALAGGVDDVLAGRPAHHHESILISWSLVLSGVADVIQGGA